MTEYRFDRYRNGRKMAEGLVLTKPISIEQAVVIAARLAQAGDIFVLRQDSRIAELEAERDAAKAGEARAVEALKRIGEKARWILLDQCVKRGHDPRSVVSDWSLNVDDYLRDEIEGIVFTLDAQPALDWLAQREREAAADCIESRRLAQRFEERLNPSPSVEYAVTEVLAAEAAALRAGKEARGEK
jgi:hypothetical protein